MLAARSAFVRGEESFLIVISNSLSWNIFFTSEASNLSSNNTVGDFW